MLIINIVILIISLLLCCLLICGFYYYYYINLNINTKIKPYLWVYWELKNDASKPPDYITLCIETMKKNGYLFNMVLLNEKNVFDYLPDLRLDINELPLIALKTDYIRVALLYKYGGIWLDADTIMMEPLTKVVDLINNGEDFIGFGCTGETCITDGYGFPSNGAMASKKHSVLMERCLNSLNKKLDEYFNYDKIENKEKKELDYFELGKLIIWDNIEKLENEQNYTYYHFPSSVDGTRDKDGKWIAKELIFNKHIDLLDEDKLMLVFLVNSSICGDDKDYNWFCKLSKEQVLNGDYFVSHLFRRALNIN
jgi:hypothetical protein